MPVIHFNGNSTGANISGATAQTLSLSSLTTNQAGSYTLLVTLGGITVTSAPATLEVLSPPANSYANIVLNDSPVAWWRLGDAPGSFVAADIMGQNGGSAFSDVVFGVQGAPGGDSDTAAQFTGYSMGTRAGNSKIVVSYNPALNNPVFTVECWALASGGTGTLRSPMTSRSTNSGTAGYSFYAGTDDHWQFWVGNGGSGWTVLEGPAVSLNQWAHLAGVYDGTNASFYVNGSLVGQTQTAFVANSLSGLNIGAGASESITGNFFFPGAIDEAAVYQTALSEAQVQQHYAAAFPTAAAPRFSSLPFDRAFLAGTAVTLNAVGYGAPPLAYQWLQNGSNVSGATASTLSLPSVAAANAGSYQVKLTHGSQSVTSAVTTLTVLNGQAVSVHFKGFENTFTIAADGGRAGFVRTTNWNEVGYQVNSGSVSNLINNLGQASSITVNWSANNNQRWNGPIDVPQGDYALLSGFIDDNGNSTPVNVTIANIPASYQQSGYSLYVYMGAPNAQSGAVTSSSWFGAVSVGSVTNYYHAVDLATWNGEYFPATNSNPTDTAPTNADYAVFTGLNAASATILVGEHPAGMAGPASISGFQLVANTVSAVPLNISHQGSTIVLSWTGSWILQETSSLAGSPWTNVIGAASPYTNNITSQSNAFFRLVSP